MIEGKISAISNKIAYENWVSKVIKETEGIGKNDVNDVKN
jgi:hypothetical protein